ncbi:amidase domain-containing protein [Roseiconus lacunae]|uniref:amidase domain-containing protein n=1 Tax=Roseiconus lacunae TaxID=2605694 RepID=UPI0011F2FA73|nr:amidase domain-containing protein [Roseiconus lacunae]
MDRFTCLLPVALITFVLADNSLAADPILVPASGPAEGKLKYDADKALAYYKKFCKQGNDCPDGEFMPPKGTDCTHFICHGLKEGGVMVDSTEVECQSKCCIRVKELAAAFYNATKKYSNVKQVKIADAKAGDFIFRVSLFGSKNHVMMLNGQPDKKGAKIFGHANNRCGEYVEFDVNDCKAYRISDL